MKKLIRILTLSFTVLSLNACSIAPGIPGIKSNSSRYAKPQKEGVDYKLVVINAKTSVIKNHLIMLRMLETKKEEHLYILLNQMETVTTVIELLHKNQ